MPLRASAALAWGVLVLVAPGCGGGGRGDAALAGVAEIDGDPVPVEDVERYFSSVLGGMDDEGPPTHGELDLVKSRLFDDFIEEEILVHEARRRGIEVSDAEVDAYLAAVVGSERPADDVDRRLARRSLMIHKLRGEEAEAAREVSNERVDAYVDEHREALASGRSLVMRSIAVSNETDAARIRREILRGEMDFAEAVQVFGEAGDRARPVEIALEDLPEEIRAAVADLAAGEVSRPVTYQGRAWLFLVEESAAADDEDELRRRARGELERQDVEQAAERLLREARARTRVVLYPSRLPFEYVEEDQKP